MNEIAKRGVTLVEHNKLPQTMKNKILYVFVVNEFRQSYPVASMSKAVLATLPALSFSIIMGSNP